MTNEEDGFRHKGYLLTVKIEFWYIGKTSFRFVKDGSTEFQQRIGRYTPFTERCIPDVKVGKKPSPSYVKAEEAKKILPLIQDQDWLVLLDEKGKRFDSIQFARQLEKWIQLSKKRIIFLVGGAWGFDQAVYQRADAKLSLSDMTFSHQLIRVLILEQLYRAFTIINNEKYHNA